MDKPFNHLIICLTFVMPVAALSGCSGPNDSPEQDAVMSISSCTARGDDGQEMSVSEFGMFVTDTAGNLYPDNIRVLNRSGKWTFAEISLSDGDKGIYAYYPYSPSCSGGYSQPTLSPVTVISHPSAVSLALAVMPSGTHGTTGSRSFNVGGS